MKTYNPIGIVPIANITPTHAAIKIWDRWRMDTKEYIARMQVYAPVTAQLFLRQLAQSEKS